MYATAPTEQVLAEIREANLTFITLAQRMLDQDRTEAMRRLGLSEAAAERIAALQPAQALRLAATNTLLCRPPVHEELVWELLTSKHRSTVIEPPSRPLVQAAV